MRIYLLLLLGITCLGCTQPVQQFTTKDKQRVVAEVRAMMDDYYNDIREDGLLAEFKYLDSSAGFFWVPPGYDTYLSYDSVASVLDRNAGGLSKIDNSWEALHIVPVTQDMASYTGTLRSVMTDTAGITTSARLIETGIVIKRDEGWKLLSGQTNVLQ